MTRTAVLVVLIGVIALTAAALSARADSAGVAIPPGATDSTVVHFRALMDARRFAAAESLAVAELAAAEAGHGPASPAVARALEWRSETMRGPTRTKADKDSAVAWMERAVAIREAAGEIDTLALVGSLLQLGRALNARNRILEGFPGRVPLARAVHLCEQARVPDSLACAEVMFELGKSGGWDKGLRRAERRPLVERALSIRERVLGPDHPEVAECLLVLSGLVAATDTSAVESTYPTEISLPMIQRARAIFEASRGPEHPDVGKALASEARAHTLRREYAESESCFARGLAIFERAYGPVSTQVSGILNVQGFDLTTIGDYDKGVPLLRRAAQVVQELDPGWQNRLIAFENLGGALMSSGEYPEAVEWLEQSVALSAQHFRTSSEAVNHAVRLYLLAHCLWTMGDYERALPLSRRILAIADSLALEPDPSFEILLLWNRMLCSVAGGDTVPVFVAVDTMLALYARGDGATDGFQEIEEQVHYAGALFVLGRHDRVRAEYERLDGVFQRSHVPECAAHGRLLRDLAEADRLAGALGAADSVGRRAADMLRRRLGERHPEVAQAQLVLAGIRRQAGDATGAFALALQAEAERREYVRVVTRSLPETKALRFTATQPSGLGLLLTTAAASGDPEQAGASWDALVRTRALVQDEVAARWREVLEANVCSSEYSEASGRYARLLVGSLGAQTGEYYVRELETARQASERAERDLAQVCVAFREERARSQIGLEDVTRALPASSALVAYARVPADEVLAGGPLFGPLVRGRSAEASAVYVALVRPPDGGVPRAVSLGRAPAIDSLVTEWRQAAGTRPGAGGAAIREARYRAVGGALRAAIWDPLEVELAGAERVFVVPDGPLALVNVAALPAAAGGYLVEQGPLVHSLSAERDLAVLRGTGVEGEGLLAVGDPDVDAAPGAAMDGSGLRAIGGQAAASKAAAPAGWERCDDLRGTQWSRLPAARREVAEVAGRWSGLGAGPAEQLLGAQATEARFKAAARGRRVLHLATHGFVLPAECRRGNEATRGGLLRGGMRVVDPFGLSGLVLAGGNRRAGVAQGEDGVLLAQEIATLDLSGVEWAVLSACETGLGEVLPGEGVYGLRRAFQVAGARTLIMSLWSVEDEATRAWMGHLYRARLEEKLDTAESVRTASLAVLAERRAKGESTHPFYWGAFVAAGDWR